jgi:opacity protein-like surface antigen
MSRKTRFAAGASAAALVMAAALALPAAAQDLAFTEQSVSSMSNGDWTGAYGGLMLGYGQAEGDVGLGDDINGGAWGLFGGYQNDFGAWVLGGELEYTWLEWTDDTTGIDVSNVARAKLRVGYDAGSFLPYVTLGSARLYTNSALEDDDVGIFYGVGADFAVSENIFVGAEYLWHEFDDYADTGINIDAQTLQGRIAYKF